MAKKNNNETIYNVKKPVLLLVIMALYVLFLAFATLGIMMDGYYGDPILTFFTLVMSLLIGIGGYFYFGSSQLSLTVSPFGLRDRSNLSKTNAGFIAWENIESMRIVKMPLTPPMLCIKLNRQAELSYRQSLRSLSALSLYDQRMRAYQTPIVINLGSFKEDPQSVYEEVRMSWLAHKDEKIIQPAPIVKKKRNSKKKPQELDLGDINLTRVVEEDPFKKEK